MELISRQAAIEAIYSLCDDAVSWIDNVIEAIEDLPTASQWIPVSERLPENSGRYLVTRGHNACGALWNRVYIANYSDLMGIKNEKIWWQGNVGKSDFERLDDVTAWKPLPMPWRGEEDETD